MDAFPNETREYRAARNALLESEAELRRHMESVAAELRALPPGGEIPEDYAFDCVGGSRPVGISELFRGGDTLMIYQFMFPRHVHDRRPRPSDGIFSALPHDEGPCPSCTALIDSWEGMMPHFKGLGGNLVIVASAPIARLAAFVHEKGWKNLRFLSAARNGFMQAYGGIDAKSQPVPMMTVLKRWPDGKIRLHWASELFHAPSEREQDPRHLGTVEPLWTLFDLTPHGRPDADEQFDYHCCGRSNPV